MRRGIDRVCHCLSILLLAVAAAALPAAPAQADSWVAPQRTTYLSANRAFRLIVTPHVPADRSVRPYVTEPLGPSAPDSAHAVLQQRSPRGHWRTQWQGPLRNEVMPVGALVADNGRWFVTFDDWGGTGTGPNVVVIYDGTGRVIRALSILDLLPEDYVRTLPNSFSSIYWGGAHSFSADGETLRLALALPGDMIFPSGYFRRDVSLATGEPAPLAGPEWERALATAAIWQVMQRGRRAAYRARAIEPILPPRSSDPEEWQDYLTEVLERREGSMAGVPMVVLFRRPPSRDYVRWGGTPRPELLSRNPSRFIAVASPDGLHLAAELAPIVAGRRPGWLHGVNLLLVADAAAWPELERLLTPSGATLVRLDPATPIPQRPERIREYQEIQAALTRNESRQD
jgi:hypothetical protein